LRHQTAWGELVQVLRSQGIVTYSLFHEPQSNQLFGYVEVESDAAWEAVRQAPVYRRWGRFLSDVVATDREGRFQALPLREVFHLGQIETAVTAAGVPERAAT
ncbi:MAG: L-rhamnose mutarotase, partial [Opitutaceae bacterium]|nr:L-rhamnose mutarotase [Opitutaceae bacterium]